MSVNWLRNVPRGVNVGYDGDQLYGGVQIDHWQEPSTFETELHEALEGVRKRMLAEHQRMHDERQEDSDAS